MCFGSFLEEPVRKERRKEQALLRQQIAAAFQDPGEKEEEEEEKKEEEQEPIAEPQPQTIPERHRAVPQRRYALV